MSNLIITVISIALVAVAALVATYYGGTAFSMASYKSKANTVLEQGKQLAAAWQLWSLDNGNVKSLVDTDWTTASGGGTSDDLVPKYTTQLPTPPLVLSTAGDGWHPATATTPAAVTVKTVEFNATWTDESNKTCIALLAIAQPSVSTIPLVTAAPNFTGPADCYINDIDSSADANTGDTVTFRQNIF